jgi:hypothetical protein
MARRRPTEGKRRTREHVLADLSANHVEKQALLCGYTAERVRLDYGIDLVVQTFNRRGEVESSRILFQLKATDRITTLAGAEAVSCRIEQANLVHWLEEPFPVVLVLYDARRDAGYWLYVQKPFRQPDRVRPGPQRQARDGSDPALERSGSQGHEKTGASEECRRPTLS